jgi:hypothetical protein
MFVHRSKFDFKCNFEPPPEWKTEEKKKEPEVLTDELVIITGKVEVSNPRWEHKDPDKKKGSPDKASIGDTILFMVDIKNFPDGALMSFDIFDTSQKPAQTIATAKGKNEKGIGKAEWKIEDKSSKGDKLELAFEGIARSKASERTNIPLVTLTNWGKCVGPDDVELLNIPYEIVENDKRLFSGKTGSKGEIAAPFAHKEGMDILFTFD